MKNKIKEIIIFILLIPLVLIAIIILTLYNIFLIIKEIPSVIKELWIIRYHIIHNHIPCRLFK